MYTRKGKTTTGQNVKTSPTAAKPATPRVVKKDPEPKKMANTPSNGVATKRAAAATPATPLKSALKKPKPEVVKEVPVEAPPAEEEESQIEETLEIEETPEVEDEPQPEETSAIDEDADDKGENAEEEYEECEEEIVEENEEVLHNDDNDEECQDTTIAIKQEVDSWGEEQENEGDPDVELVEEGDENEHEESAEAADNSATATADGNDDDKLIKTRKIWSGTLEWPEKKVASAAVMRGISCSVSSKILADGIVETNADNWVTKLHMKFMSKKLLKEKLSSFLKDSKIVVFQLQPGDDFDALTKVMTADFAACIRLTAPAEKNIQVMILLYVAEKKTLFGFIPNKGGVFIKRFAEVIRQHQQQQQQPKVDKAKAAAGVAAKKAPIAASGEKMNRRQRQRANRAQAQAKSAVQSGTARQANANRQRSGPRVANTSGSLRPGQSSGASSRLQGQRPQRQGMQKLLGTGPQKPLRPGSQRQLGTGRSNTQTNSIQSRRNGLQGGRNSQYSGQQMQQSNNANRSRQMNRNDFSDMQSQDMYSPMAKRSRYDDNYGSNNMMQNLSNQWQNMLQNNNGNNNNGNNNNGNNNNSNRISSNMGSRNLMIYDTRLGVVPEGKQELFWNAWNSALMAKVLNSGGRFQIQGSRFDNGIFKFTLVSGEDFPELQDMVNSLPQLWYNAQLGIRSANPQSKIKATFFVNGHAAQLNTEAILQMLGKQNNGLRVGLWKVFHRENKRDGCVVVVSIDDQSVRALENTDGRAFLLDSNVMFSIDGNYDVAGNQQSNTYGMNNRNNNNNAGGGGISGQKSWQSGYSNFSSNRGGGGQNYNTSTFSSSSSSMPWSRR